MSCKQEMKLCAMYTKDHKKRSAAPGRWPIPVMPYGEFIAHSFNYGGCSPRRRPSPLTVFCETELKTLRSRLHFEPLLPLERFQKRQNEKCSEILEPGGGRRPFWGTQGGRKIAKKHTGKLDKKNWDLESGVFLHKPLLLPAPPVSSRQIVQEDQRILATGSQCSVQVKWRFVRQFFAQLNSLPELNRCLFFFLGFFLGASSFSWGGAWPSKSELAFDDSSGLVGVSG